MVNIKVEELTIEQVHDAYQKKLFTVEELVKAFQERIQKIDSDENGPKLNALAAHNKQAVEEAKSLDEAFGRDRQFVGPLHGIPIVVKDHVMTKGLTTTFGSVVAKNFVPEEDATVVTKLKEAGAVILAKASLPDWGTDYFSTSSLLGNVLNPYDLNRDPGGSSGGTAAAVAANLAIVGLGSDSAGSIRIPTSFCNLVGLRPTVGLISGHGASPGILYQCTLGPVGRTVKDVARMMDVLVGFDEKDVQTGIHAVATPPRGGSYAAQLGATAESSPIKVGVIRGLFGSDNVTEEAAVNKVMEKTITSLRAAGVTIVDIEIPNLKENLEGSTTLLSRARYDIDNFIRPNFGVDFAELLSSGRYPKGNVMIPYTVTQGSATPYEHKDYGKQMDLREELEHEVLLQMHKNDVSALIFPAVKVPPPLYADIDPKMLRAYLPVNTAFASQLRWPSVCVPVGFTDDDLPVGMEITGPPLKDQKLLNLAHRVEEATKARRVPLQ